MSDLSSIVPRLDDIEFDQLVERSRALIPRYAPEWTDHNLHDPGITIIDLLAWIVDQQIYRVGFVGGRHRAAFAALLGQRVSGPQPARGSIWPERTLGADRFIEAGTEVTCVERRDLVVSLERDLYLTAAAIEDVRQVVEGVEQPIPIGGEAGSARLGAGTPLADTTLLIGFDRPLSSSKKTAPVPLGIEVNPPPGPAPSPARPWGPVDVAYRVGTGPWLPVDVQHDGTSGLSMTGVMVVGIPPTGVMVVGIPPTAAPPAAGPSATVAELRLRFHRGFFPVAPQIEAVSVNVLPVVQLRVEEAARLADGGDRPDQIVEFGHDDLTEVPSRPGGGSLEIEVAGERWEKRLDFASSGPDDLHYVTGPDRLVFGNGLNGRRPPLGAAIAHTGVARTRGADGNVRAGLTWTVGALAGEGLGYGSNRQALSGGSAATGIGDLVARAREAATHRQVLLTDDDLTDAARSLPGMAVARAEVLPRFDRRFPELDIDDARTLVVVPPADAPGYLDEVAALLEARRVLGERLLVQGPVIAGIDVWLVVTVEPGVITSEAEAAVEDAVRCRLSALRRSESVAPWPLGRTVTASEIEALAVGVPGVATVLSVQLASAGGQPSGEPIGLRRDALAEAGRVDVVARPGEGRSQR